MMPSYLLNSEGLDAFTRFVESDTLFAFDLDGTLAPIVDDYSAALIGEPVKATLERLVKLAKVAVITGRSRKDALAILGFEPHLVIGNHGSEWPTHDSCRDWQHVARVLKWREQLHGMLLHVQGVEIEFKGESLSIHYRKSDDQEKTISLINAAIEKLSPSPRLIGGKCVVNVLPAEALNKGEALMAAMGLYGSRRAIYIGDDVTDEEVFRLRSADVFGIHIGKDEQTAASYYLNGQSELLELIGMMVGMLESHQQV